jgi:hypothetical protein
VQDVQVIASTKRTLDVAVAETRVAQRNRTEFYKLLSRHGLEPGNFKHGVV